MLRNALFAAALACGIVVPAAHADPVYWSLNVGVPGVVTQVGNGYGYGYAPAPVYAVPPAVVYTPPPGVSYYPGYYPGYGYVVAPRRYEGPRWHGRRHWRHDDDDDR